MKLPTKRDYSSRSMASAMRRPVLEEGRDKYIGYQQGFTPMPTNYDDVGNAKARAALAKGEAGIALAQVGLDATKAVDSAFQIQNKSRLLAKKAEFASWLGGYVADASMRDLSLQTGKGKYGYETEKANFNKELRQFEDELNARHGIDDPYMAEEWRIARMGMLDQFGTQLDFLIDGAKDERAVADAGSALEKVQDHASLDKWAKEVGVFVFGPNKLNELVDLKTQEIEINSAYITIRDNPASGSNNFLEGEIETILEREDLKPDTREKMIGIIEAKKKENVDRARLSILNATDPGEIWAIWEFESGTNGNLPEAFETQVREQISQIESRGFIEEMERYGKEGNLEMVADEALYASQNDDLTPNHRADIQATQQRLVMSITEREIRHLMAGENLTSKYLDEDGNLNETYQNSKVAIRIAEIGAEINGSAEGARKYGLAWDNPDFRENAEKFLGALERVAKANAQRAVDAKAVQVKLSKEESYIRRMAADPSQMRKNDWTNFTADQAAKHAQDIYELWLQGEGIRVSEGNPNDYATYFTALSGVAPAGYVSSLTQIVTNPATRTQEEVQQALAGLTDMWTVNPEILDQKGLDGEGFDVAFEAAWYMKHTGQGALGLTEFLKGRSAMQANPEESKRKVETAIDGMKEGGDFDNAYAQMREGSGWMPETISDQMRGDIERILETIAPTTHDNRWAYRKAISRAMSMYGVEERLVATSPTDFEKKSQWVYQSIYRFHQDGAGADSASQLQGESGSEQWRLRGSQNNLVQMTIDDYAKQHGYEPERITTMYVPAVGGAYWMMMDVETGMPIELRPGSAAWEKAEAENPGAGKHAMIIKPNQLSFRAQERKQLVMNTQEYNAAEASYKEWQKWVGVVSDGPLWKQMWSAVDNALSGPQYQGVDDLPPPSPEERDMAKAWDKRLQDSEPGSLERAQASAMKDLLKSDWYRVAVTSGRGKGAQKIIDITLARSEAWWNAKQLDTVHDLQAEDMAKGVR